MFASWRPGVAWLSRVCWLLIFCWSAPYRSPITHSVGNGVVWNCCILPESCILIGTWCSIGKVYFLKTHIESRAITLLLNKVTQPTQSLYTVLYVWVNNFTKMISAWYYLLDILVTGITHDERTTITLPPSMGLSWPSSTLVLTVGFLGSLYIASRVQVFFRFFKAGSP